ncbi:GDSL-type esterase/lipase family protein [Merismopedia glauca]|uniref:G-D-S-L family lipolytic protein n=1 Tax=Merismopedia glauca CCAP 1448/3 TaxID=1296344 RepID=A0A2T1BYN5_9CYAN|nr:GDSL-type esterase/lipase family protein [Merismopedia glauca]PSB01054.1 G-D-S-L family lipolytic protein [Merismopedia glauca CCAP 1448/3]
MQTFAIPTFDTIISHPHPLKILAIGDSIIYGYGDSEGGGWVDRLKRQWMLADNSGHVIYNLGVRGNGVKQVSDRLESEFRQRGELRNRFPDALIISVGVNDTARLGHSNGRNFTPLADFETEVAHLLDNSLRLIPNQPLQDRVLFVGMVPVDEEKMPFSNSLYFSNSDQYQYKQVIKQACQTRNIPYLDIFDLWCKRGTNWCRQHLSQDGLHPNSRGYQALLGDILSWEPMQKLGLVEAI